jgi:hypothetical protein
VELNDLVDPSPVDATETQRVLVAHGATVITEKVNGALCFEAIAAILVNLISLNP